MRRYSATYKIVTALFTLYYLLSLCGFNVHHDTVCGKDYLTLLYLGTGCSDIHPDSSCCGQTDCSGHSEACEKAARCGCHGACEDGSRPACGEAEEQFSQAESADAGDAAERLSGGHCSHCFNEACIADDTADLRYGGRDWHLQAALAATMTDHSFRRNQLETSSAGSKVRDDGRLRAIPLSMLCVSRT